MDGCSLVYWPVGWLVGQLVGLLVGWLAFLLAGFFTSSLAPIAYPPNLRTCLLALL